jgi:2-iminobutanoate/2-iminopropanoate deaminase
MSKTAISTNRAPRAIGPYSQAVECDGFVFCSGQIGLDPATGNLVEGGVREQTVRALDNLRAVLEAAGCAPADVVRTTVYLADMGDFALMNECYGAVFTGTPPARSTLQAAKLPKGALVELDAIARKPR